MRLLEPFTFFIDRCLGKRDVPNAVRAVLAHGETIVVHDLVLAQNAPDLSWLTLVKSNKYVAITSDQRVRFNEMERAAFRNTGAAVFVFTGQGLQGPQKGAIIAGALPSVRRAVRRFHTAITGTITRSGDVTVGHSAGEDFQPPKFLR